MVFFLHLLLTQLFASGETTRDFHIRDDSSMTYNKTYLLVTYSSLADPSLSVNRLVLLLTLALAGHVV